MPVIHPLSISEKALIHLSKVRFDRSAELVPKEISQGGIAEGIGISRTHVPRAVKDLIRDELIEETKRYVKSGSRRIKTYFITPKGLDRAREVENRILSQIVPAKVQDSIVQGMTIRQLENAFHRRIDILGLTGEEEYLDLDQIRSTGITDFSGSPRVHVFLDREEALESIKHFLKSHSMILTVYGARGIGTSSLVKHFIEMLDEWNVFWTSLAEYRTADEIMSRVASFAELLDISPEAILQSESGSNTLLVFDGYFDVDDAVVELFSTLVERRQGAKAIITCRDSTPSYNRFYHREDIESGIVQEMTLKGLPEREARLLLENEEIPDDAFNRIYALTRGSPMVLTMLRDRNEKGLRRRTTFTNEEIRFLLFEAAAKEQSAES